MPYEADRLLNSYKPKLHRFKLLSILLGALLVLAGISGIIVPQLMAVVVNVFFGWLLIFGGVLGLYLVFLFNGNSFIAWLKPILPIFTGLVFLLNPDIGIASLTLLLAFYLLLDAYGNLGLSFEVGAHKLRGWMLFNGIVSLLLSLLILLFWASQSAEILGMIVGISLLFDGIIVFLLGLFAIK